MWRDDDDDLLEVGKNAKQCMRLEREGLGLKAFLFRTPKKNPSNDKIREAVRIRAENLC